jgi:hypothetical protein
MEPETDKKDKQEADPSNILRQLRHGLVDAFVALARVLFFWIPGGDVAKGKALMACHPIFIAAMIGLFFVMPPRSPARVIIAGLGVAVVASQWLLGGCVVTRAEQKLTGNKDTILDPFLMLAHIHVNRDTRIAATIGSSTAIVGIMIWVLFCDLFRSSALV